MSQDYPEELFPPFEKPDIGPPPGSEAKLNPKPRYKNPKYKGSEKLKGKVALVTGGDSGIGRSIVYHFAKEGADIIFVCLTNETKDAETIQSEVKELGQKCDFLTKDLKSWTNCENVISFIKEKYNRLDILVNNAAVQKHISDIDQLTIDQWDNTFKTNIYAYFYLIKAAYHLMPKGSSIINIGSITGLEGSEELIDYSATKGAIHALTKSLSKNLLKKGVRVNGIAPGPVWTPLNPAERNAEDIKGFGANVPFGRPAQPEEIAPCAVFLASETDSSYITGEIVPILGGMS